MRYIYPALMKQYNTYIKNTNKNALREFQMTVPELKALEDSSLTDRQRDFLRYYDYRMPVGTSGCVMNKICRRFEEEFDSYVKRHNEKVTFDYSFLRSDASYTPTQFKAIKKLYEDYNQRLKNYKVLADYERIDDVDALSTMHTMNEEFEKDCSVLCTNRDALCNIILDICYTRNSTKRFAWNMCGSSIIRNLLKNNNNLISYPTIDLSGDVSYGGDNFTIMTKQIGVNE